MSVGELSPSAQNYLKAIWSLMEWSDEPVSASALAARVGLRVSTTSEGVRKLREQGLVEHSPYGTVTLSPQGRAHALAMVRRHRLLETFLVEVLGYRWDQVHDEAEQLEHAVSDFLIDRVDEHLGHPERDPHGDPIPAADGTVTHPEATLLSNLPPGSTATVARISDANPTLLQFLAERGIGVGTQVQTRAGAPFTGVVELVLGDGVETVQLGPTACQSIWLT